MNIANREEAYFKYKQPTIVAVVCNDNDWIYLFEVIFYVLDYKHDILGNSHKMTSEEMHKFIINITPTLYSHTFNADSRTTWEWLNKIQVYVGEEATQMIAKCDVEDRQYYAYDSRLPINERYFFKA